MMDVIDFLERMGHDAQLRHAPQDEVELALAQVELDPGVHAAILARDSSQLQELLGQGPLCSMQVPGQEDEEEEDEGEDDAEGKTPEKGLRDELVALAL